MLLHRTRIFHSPRTKPTKYVFSRIKKVSNLKMIEQKKTTEYLTRKQGLNGIIANGALVDKSNEEQARILRLSRIFYFYRQVLDLFTNLCALRIRPVCANPRTCR
jgi:hypothetical protein